MLQLSGDCEDNKNMSAFIDGREEKIESHLSVQSMPALLLFDLLQSSLDHTLEMMLAGKVYFLFAQTWFLAALHKVPLLIPNPLVN